MINAGIDKLKNEIRDMDQCQAQLTRPIEYVAWGWVGLGAQKRTIARELAINPSAPLRKRLRPKTETPAIKQNPSLEPHMFSMGSAQRRWPNDAHTSEVALQT